MMIAKEILDKLEYQKILDHVARYTNTENGKQIILDQLPYASMEEIVRQGNYVSEAKEILIKKDIPPIDFIPDLNESLAKSTIEGTFLDVKVIQEILNLAIISRKLFQFLSSEEEFGMIKKDLAADLFVDKVFEKHISDIFDQNGQIRDNATDELRKIRREIRDKEENLRKVVGKILKKMSESFLVQDEYVTQRDGRMVLPVKAEYKRSVKGFIHSESATGQTVYIEPEETLELNNEILSLGFAEKREIERILRGLTRKIGENSLKLRSSLRKISEIDSVFAKSRYSMEIIGSFPGLDENLPFSILEGRHPILLKKLGREKTVPLNLEIKDENVILITGPNAGGKTVVLKTVGLLTSLVMSGIHVPVNPDSNFHFMNDILIDVGDYQSIEDDLSTFSAHLSNIKNILNKADDKSLILIDEIGTGTDPSEGSAIATAVLILLRDKGCKVLATTHHGNLKLTANSLKGFQNASMEFDTANLIPTYRFNQGLPGSSYAFEVAERIGFDKLFTDHAKSYLDTDKSKVEELLIDLETKARDLQLKLNRLEIENARLAGLTRLYEEKNKKLEEQKNKILEETKHQADIYLRDINKTVESAIKNIRESNASKEIVKEEREKITQIKVKHEELKKTTEKHNVKDYVPKVGDYVKIKDTATSGEILEIDELKNRAVISAGSIKVQVKMTTLIPAKEENQNISSYGYETYIPSIVSYRLDIRGKKPEEAEFEVVRFIDDAYSAGTDRIEIVHGKGTGALKMSVHQILKHHEHVSKFYYANIEYGGEGITIIELK